MRVVKVIVLIWSVVSATLALAATLLEWPPASFFLEIRLTSHYGLSLKLVFLLSWLSLFIIVFPPLMVYNAMVSRRNRKAMPQNMQSVTGIIVKRNKALQEAMFPFDVVIDGETKARVTYGQSVFVGLKPGSYEMQVEVGNKKSIVQTIQVQPTGLSRFEVDINPIPYKFFAPKTGYIQVNPVMDEAVTRTMR